MFDLVVSKEYYTKLTDKSLCFLLWGKKRIAFPLKFMKQLREGGKSYTFQMPKWYIREHGLRSLIEDERLRDENFPLKRDLKKKAEMKAERPLIDDQKAQAAPSMTLKQPEKSTEAISIGQGGLFDAE